MTGLRAELAVSGPGNCPLASLSRDLSEPLENVTWTRSNGGGVVTEEFSTGDDVDDGRSVPVFSEGHKQTYHIERDADPCACELVEEAGYPLANVDVRDGWLALTLNLPDADALREVVATLSDVSDTVEVQYLIRDANEDASDPVIVDRGQLTARQREVLEVAYAEGYFEYPRKSSAGEVAEKLDISRSTFAEHLAAAQSQLFETIAGNGNGNGPGNAA